jgi:hypothetical protein
MVVAVEVRVRGTGTPPAGVCQVAAVPEVAVSTWPAVGVAGTVVPLILATVGPGYVPERSPDAVPLGARLFVVVGSVAESGPAVPAATVGMSVATAMLGTPVAVVFFSRPVARPAREVPLMRKTVGPG